MVDKMVDYGERIAKVSLLIPSITLRLDNPFTWASGYRMPIYNDNRLLLSSYNYRMLVTDAFIEIIEENGLTPDIVSGTMTAGVAPAVSLANKLNLPLAMQIDGESLLYTREAIEYLGQVPQGEADLVISTCPYGIVAGVTIANELKVPFAYIRQKKKTHGLEQQIEGKVSPGNRAFLVDHYLGESYFITAWDILKEAGVRIIHSQKTNIAGFLEKDSIAGKKMLKVEDLVSMGGSAATEIDRDRKLGAIVTDCLAIFSYGLAASEENFTGIECNLYVALFYDVLLEVAQKIGSLTPEGANSLKEWKEDPLNWGETRGFPRIKNERNN